MTRLISQCGKVRRAWRFGGTLPLVVDGKGDNKTFTVKLRNPSGQMDEKRFVVFKDKNRLKVTPPEDIAQYMTKSK
jgi:hypothetical protein